MMAFHVIETTATTTTTTATATFSKRNEMAEEESIIRSSSDSITKKNIVEDHENFNKIHVDGGRCARYSGLWYGCIASAK